MTFHDQEISKQTYKQKQNTHSFWALVRSITTLITQYFEIRNFNTEQQRAENDSTEKNKVCLIVCYEKNIYGNH